MSSFARIVVEPTDHGFVHPVPPGQLLSDAALATYAVLSPDEWRGCHSFPGGAIVFPDPGRARELFAAAAQVAKVDSDAVGSVRLLEKSIRLDYIGALNGEHFVRRAQGYAVLGRHEQYKAVHFYDMACIFGRLQHWNDAAAIYLVAAECDPLFVWPLNNHAWMRATAIDPREHNGSEAIDLAEKACALSGWGCWCFIGTLAAAFARAGDFRRAVAWQRISLHLTPRTDRGEAATILREFEARRAYTDHKRDPVAGHRDSDADLAQIDVQELRQRALELLGIPHTQIN